MGELQKKGLSGCGFNRSIEPECFEQPLPLSERFNLTCSDQSSDEGMKSKADLILSKVANRSFNRSEGSDSTDSTNRGRLQGLLKCLWLLAILLAILRTSDFQFGFKSMASHLVDRMILRLYP